MKLLEDKVVLITGASRGIGKAIAERCVAEGAKVAFTYLSSEEKANALIAELTKDGGVVKGFKSNAAEFDAAQTLVEDVVKEFGTVDVLVNKDRKSTRLNSSHVRISYAVFCLKKKKN